MTGLFGALKTILVDEGPLVQMHEHRLPPTQVYDVDVAMIPASGIGGEFALGSRPIASDTAGVTTDAGLLWWHSGVQFQVRGRNPYDDPSGPMRVAEQIRDVLCQYRGEGVVKAGHEVVRIGVTDSPNVVWFRDRDLGQAKRDARRRAEVYLGVEVWHRPVFRYEVDAGLLTQAGDYLLTAGGDRLAATVPPG